MDSQAVPRLTQWLNHSDATVRYWAATGIGNRVGTEADLLNSQAALTKLLDDTSENVRIVAARALAGIGKPKVALSTLSDVLDNGSQWARVHAAIVLDEMEDDARPAIAAMERNNVKRKGFVADGKYAVRVLNKALNDLLGTTTTVP